MVGRSIQAIILQWVLLAVAQPVQALTGGLTSSPWPDYGGGLRNTHLTSALGPSGPVHVVWQYAVSDVNNSFNRPYRQGILGDDGTIYFATYSTGHAQIIALNPSGTVKWDQVADAVGNWLAIDSNGHLFNEGWPASSTSGFIYERSTANGSIIWGRQYFGVPLESGPTVGNDGTIYSASGGLTALTQAGQQLWQITGLETQYRNPAIATDGTLYLDGQFALSAVSPSGSVLWTTPTGKRLGPVAIDANGNLYVGTANTTPSSFYSFTSSGALRWQRNDLGGAAAIGPDGIIYAGYQGVLHAIQPNTGLDLWSYPTGPIDEFGVEGVTVDTQGNLYLANVQGILMSLSPSGALRWQYDLAPNDSSNIFPGAPIIGRDGTIYVPGGNTRMFFALVPEPSSAVFVALAIVGSVYRCRRASRLARPLGEPTV